jgi:hypothetical protein
MDLNARFKMELNLEAGFLLGLLVPVCAGHNRGGGGPGMF